MDATILSITSAKATGNEVMVTPTQLLVTASAIIPTILTMKTFLGIMMNYQLVKPLRAWVIVHKATQ